MVAFKTTNFQSAKKVILNYYDALDNASDNNISDVIVDATNENYKWCGMHPFNNIDSPEKVANDFWKPLKKSFTSLQRRADIFYAGLNEIDDFSTTWVCQMGHFMGLFDNEWLGIKPTNRMVFIRYVEFNKVENGKITETCLHIDIPAIMRQAGYEPFRPDTGVFLIQPGPRTHDGLLFTDADEKLGQQTLNTIDLMKKMVSEGRLDKNNHDGLGNAWHDDMIWFGPSGIGATYTKERYQKQHRKPLIDNMDFNIDEENKKINHTCRMAEGNYGGFFGWPNFRCLSKGGFMDLPASDKIAEFRVVDIYRIQDGKIAENWIFMDLLHFMKTQGIDVLADMKKKIN